MKDEVGVVVTVAGLCDCSRHPLEGYVASTLPLLVVH